MSVILPSTYTDGTVTCTNGSPNVVGTGTMWINTILPGDFFWTPSGESVRVLTVVDDTHITLAYNWPGATQAVTGPYEIRFQSDQGRVQETTRQLLERMQSGNLYAFAGLSGDTDLIPIFTSPGAMSLISKQDLINGVNYDVQVDDLADRAAYDTQVAGFTVLVSDNGDGRSAIYSKNSNASGDWSAPAFVTGPTGATGPAGPIGLVSRGTYSGATAYVPTDWVLYNGSSWECIAPTTGNAPPALPTTSNTYWTLIAAKGTDGTGTGDVVGPGAAVNKRIATFNGTTGKLIADSGVSIDLLAPENATAITNLNSVTQTGFYKFGATTTNAPFTVAGVVVTIFSSSTLGRQIAYRLDTMAVWQRFFNTSWSAWVQTSDASGVTFDNTTAGLPGAPTTVAAAINALATNTAAGKNDALFAIEIADLKGQRMGMVGGVADSFDDTTGVALAGIGGIDGNTVLAWHMDGTNGSTTITDSSFANKTFVVNGDAKISTAQSKFGGASLILDGTGDFLSKAYDADFDFSGDFTIDGWIRTTTDSKMIWMKGGGSGGIMISVGTTSLATGVTANKAGVWLSGGVTVSGTTTVTDGNWHHIAVTRSGSTVRFFTDGNLEGTGTHSAALTANISSYLGSDGTGNYFNGYIDEFRVSKNIARWTAAFTPPTGAYTVVGGLDANTLVMLHLDGTNGSTTFTDSAPSPKTWTRGGDAQISTAQSKFGGASMLLDGTGDYIVSNAASDLALGTGDFTVDFWMRPSSALGSSISIWSFRSASVGTNAELYFVSGSLRLYANNADRITGTATFTVGTWYHIAVVRSAGVTKLYVNGVQDGSSYTDANNYAVPSSGLFIGTDYGLSGKFPGNIDEFRVSNVARWTTNFVPYNIAFFADTTASANYVYDAANDYFYPSSSTTTQDIGTVSSSIAYTASTRVDRSVFLTPGDVIAGLGAHLITAASIKMKILKRNSAGNYDVVVDQAFSHPGGGYATVNLTVPFTVPGTGDYCVGIFLPASTNSNRTVATNYGYVATTDVTGTGVTFTEISDAQIPPFRVLKSPTPNNMTLLSVAYTASAVPSTARVAVQLADSLSLTPGTDFTMEVSRDGGTTWTAVTLALTMPLFGGVKMYEGTATISGQPSGTAMMWRFKTLTNKLIIASGVVLQQS